MTASADAAQLARGCAAAMWREDRASQGVGMAIEHVAPGEARLTMTVTERMVNGHGLCHGGYIFMLADSAMAFASNSYNIRAVASHGTISFLQPAHVDDRLVAQATERHRAGRTGLYDVSVRRADGMVVAEFRGHTLTTGAMLGGEAALRHEEP
jgi:acyl-CoA thioesterase